MSSVSSEQSEVSLPVTLLNYAGKSNDYRYLNPNQSQKLVLTSVGYKLHENLLIILPTGSGKTMIYEFIVHSITEGNRIIVAPFIELVKQIVHTMRSIYDSIKVIPLFGGSQMTINKNTSNSLIIGTPESILTHIRKIKNIKLLIIDEIHMIDDRSRGVTIEKLINTTLTSNPDVWLVFSTATLSKYSYPPLIHKYKLLPYTKPTVMSHPKKYITIHRGTFPNVNPNQDLDRIREESLFEILKLHDSAIIFISTIKKLTQVLRVYINQFLSINCSDFSFNILSQLMVDYKFGFHHGDLKDDEKSIAMQHIRSGSARHIFCTATLLTGIDIPGFEVLVVYQAKVFSPKERILDMFEYIQLVGRVGRYKDANPLIYVINIEDCDILNNYGSIEYWENFDSIGDVLIETNSDYPPDPNRIFDVAVPSFQSGLVKSLMTSYSAYRASEDVLNVIDYLIKDMVKQCLIDSSNRPTRLGQLVFRNHLSLTEYTNLMQFSDNFERLRSICPDLMYISLTTLIIYHIYQMDTYFQKYLNEMNNYNIKINERFDEALCGIIPMDISQRIILFSIKLTRDVYIPDTPDMRQTLVLIRHKTKTISKILKGIPKCIYMSDITSRLISFLDKRIQRDSINPSLIILEISPYRDLSNFIGSRLQQSFETILEEYLKSGGSDLFNLELLYKQVKK
jgi:superfamily II DNA/RNA helicase